MQVVDDVVARYRDVEGVEGSGGQGERARRGGEQRGEDARVGAVDGAGLRLGRVALEDGEAEGSHGGRRVWGVLFTAGW